MQEVDSITQEINNNHLSMIEDVLEIASGWHGGLKFFDSSSLLNLSCTSKRMHRVTKEEVNKRNLVNQMHGMTKSGDDLVYVYLNSRHDLVYQLVVHVLRDYTEGVMRLIEKCSVLLYYKAKVVLHPECILIATAFQAALGTENMRLCNLILPYLNGLEEGEASRQFNEQFPYGLDAEYFFIRLMLLILDLFSIW